MDQGDVEGFDTWKRVVAAINEFDRVTARDGEVRHGTKRAGEEMEIASFAGNVTRDRNGNPVVHAHCVVALLRNGVVYAGHFIEGHISLTMQMYLEDSEPLSATFASAN
jgi:predicted DNA-binding protein with PD1-like motif